MRVAGRELDEKDKRIIQLIMRRVPWKKISSIVFLSRSGIKHRIKVMKNHYQCEDLTALIDYLVDNGLI